MSRKLIETDGPAWVQEGLITEAQRQQLLRRYPVEEQAIGLLPLLGGLLLGLGILSLVAANWQGLPELVWLALLVGTLVAAYLSGELALQRGQRPLGIGLLSVGLLSFGAGIVLTGQMYHLVSHDAKALLLWGGVGLGLTWLYRSRFLYLLTLAIVCLAQAVSTQQFQVYSYVGLALLLLGLGVYWFRRPDKLLAWSFSLGWLAHMGLLLDHYHLPFVWLIPLLGLLYAAADWLPARSLAAPVQVLPLAAGWLVAASVAVNGEQLAMVHELREGGSVYPLALLGLALLSAAGKWRQRSRLSLADWLIFLPLFYLPMNPLTFIVQLLVLYAFAGAVLWRGHQAQWRPEVNAGTVLFVLASALAYFRLTWAFFDKSLFFIVGGVLLLALSWWLRRRNERVLAAAAHDQAVTPAPHE